MRDVSASDELRANNQPCVPGLGRSRGGLTSKTHLVVEGRGPPMAVLVTRGYVNDSSVFETLMARIRIRCPGAGLPRTRPETLLTNKGHAARRIRLHLCRRGVKPVIPHRRGQRANRLRKAAEADGHLPATPASTATRSSAASTASSNGAPSPPATAGQPIPSRHPAGQPHPLDPRIIRQVLVTVITSPAREPSGTRLQGTNRSHLGG
ncbi:transposase [Actinocorallia aurea]